MENSVSRHILPSAATMVGVCITSISLVKIIEARTGPSRVDEYMAINSMLFLLSALTSYLSLRNPSARLSRRLERIADWSFMVGLMLLCGVSLLFAYEVI